MKFFPSRVSSVNVKLHFFCSVKCFTKFKIIYPEKHYTKAAEVFLAKGVLKICSKFTREHPCRTVISEKWQSKFIKIALRHGCSPVNLLHIFRTTFPRNTSEWLLVIIPTSIKVAPGSLWLNINNLASLFTVAEIASCSHASRKNFSL